MTRIGSENLLIAHIKNTAKYKHFEFSRLPAKVEREEKAWLLLENNRGRYTTDLLDRILYIVDYEKGEGWWFGKMISSNKKKILETPIETLSAWIDYICFSGKHINEILDKSIGEMHINGTGKGLVTLLLYLTDPTKHTIWVKTTHDGLFTLGRIDRERKNEFGAQYVEFNNNALEFASNYGLGHREIDFILFVISRYVTYDNGSFNINIS